MTQQDFFQQFKTDSNIWIDEFRKEIKNHEDQYRIMFTVLSFVKNQKTYDLSIPKYETKEQRNLVENYLRASIFNIFSAVGGSKAVLYFDQSNQDLVELINRVLESFQIHEKNRKKYGKVLNAVDRVCKNISTESFSFATADLKEIPNQIINQKSHHAESAAAEVLKEKINKGNYCGIDIGGTDIKIAFAKEGELIAIKEYNWNPASFVEAEQMIMPIVRIIKYICYNEKSREGDTLIEDKDLQNEEHLDVPFQIDGLGISFPDIVIQNRILGGESPKTKNMRETQKENYDIDFAKFTNLQTYLEDICAADNINIINDGNMAAFTAAFELQRENQSEPFIAHTLGTDLGTGWIYPDYSIPDFLLEMYGVIIDIQDENLIEYGPEDLRSIKNINSELADVRRYVGQEAAFRIAYQINPELLEGFLDEKDGNIRVMDSPIDRRKECLQHLMDEAENGNLDAAEVFIEIGRNFGHCMNEMEYLYGISVENRYLFGRFLRSQKCVSCLKEGCRQTNSRINIIAVDENFGTSSLMKDLEQKFNQTVAHFGQAIGAIYFGAFNK